MYIYIICTYILYWWDDVYEKNNCEEVWKEKYFSIYFHFIYDSM